MTHRRVFDLELAFVSSCLLIAVGCGSLPNDEDAKEVLQKQIELFAQVKSFSKTDGCELTVMGVKTYKMSYNATVEIVKDEKSLNDYCHSDARANMTFLSDYKSFIARIGFVPTPGAIFPRVGQIFNINGSLIFSKSESGWHCVSFE